MEIFTSIILLLAGSGVFIAGMKMMSDGLEKSAGAGLKKLLGKISNNRFAGVGVGAAVTAIIQSSAATTVMAIGFVNAGVMTLMQAVAIIMGANIGTTVTGLIVSLSSLNISVYAGVLAFIGVMMTFFKNGRVKKIGSILCGLGILFVGLEAMSSAFDGSGIKNAFAAVFSAIDFPLLLILIGTVFTALIQSSSAVTGLLIILVGQGAIEVESALFIVLGSNVGTCVTAIIASIGTSTNAKRTAFIHLFFNLVGTIIFTVVLWLFSGPIVGVLQRLFSNPQMQIAWFHVLFNVTTTCILLPFIKQLVKIAEFVIKDKKTPEDEIYQLRFIDDRLLQAPPVAVAQVKKEILYMASLARENLEAGVSTLLYKDEIDAEHFRLNEAKINYAYHAVARYLIKLASLSLSETDEKLVGAYHHVITNIERVGDYSENFLEQSDKMSKEGIDFSDAAVAEVYQMYGKVISMYDDAIRAFEKRDYDILPVISATENEVDALKEELGHRHIERLNRGDCAVERGTYFFAVISALERIADHMVNVAFSIKNPTGSQSQRKEMNEVIR